MNPTTLIRGIAARLSPERLVPRTQEIKHPAGAVPTLRMGVIGFGVIGRRHAEQISSHPNMKLAGVAARGGGKADAAAAGIRWFESAEALLDGGDLDGVVIAAPHPAHGELVSTALHAGLHVLCEKPLTLEAQDARDLAHLARAKGRLLGVCLQTRFRPEYEFVKALLESETLGALIRCDISENHWRPADYYRSATWRGRWAGEGGGVLVNQAPHVLDRYGWIAGWPSHTMAMCSTVMHAIETEDTVQAIFSHAGGAHGHVRVTTAEAPWNSRLEVVGERGMAISENGRVRVSTFRRGLRDFYLQNPEAIPDLEMETRSYAARVVPDQQLYARLYANFAAAAANLEPLAVDGFASADCIALANSIRLSSERGTMAPNPPPQDAHRDLMKGKILAGGRLHD